ncbi:hypothetical protein ACQPYK_43580 [Streptosporangium sp. CA-135522]|uniref:hypothetical protein n=1 Tax=Streptosporangium sp. CA-135522 TaxID=3240072 RepID=UPI003D92330C
MRLHDRTAGSLHPARNVATPATALRHVTARTRLDEAAFPTVRWNATTPSPALRPFGKV